jgi:hypothetical protein
MREILKPLSVSPWRVAALAYSASSVYAQEVPRALGEQIELLQLGDVDCL